MNNQKPLTVYYSRPFTGQTVNDILNRDINFLFNLALIYPMFNILDPYRGRSLNKEILNLEWSEANQKFPKEFFIPVERDFEDVKVSDLVIVNLKNRLKDSVGCNFEIAWAQALNIPCYVYTDQEEHVMIKNSARIITSSLDNLVNQILKDFNLKPFEWPTYIQNSISLPDGRHYRTLHRHDYVSFEFEGQSYFIDGGNDYFRSNLPASLQIQWSNTLDSTNSFEDFYKNLLWRTTTGKEELICQMDLKELKKIESSLLRPLALKGQLYQLCVDYRKIELC